MRAKAERDWKLSRDGDYGKIGASLVLGFFKSKAIEESREFVKLSVDERHRIQAPIIPSYEVAFNVILPESD